MLNDEQTMSYNHACGGTIRFSEERWMDWYDKRQDSCFYAKQRKRMEEKNYEINNFEDIVIQAAEHNVTDAGDGWCFSEFQAQWKSGGSPTHPRLT